MGIGKNVERLRKRRGLTFDAVAIAVGTDPQAISQMEKRDSKTSNYAAKLARFFGVNLEDLMSEDFDIDAAHERTSAVAPLYMWISVEEAVLITDFRTTDDRGRELMKLTASGVPKVLAPGIVRDKA